MTVKDMAEGRADVGLSGDCHSGGQVEARLPGGHADQDRQNEDLDSKDLKFKESDNGISHGF